MTINRIIKTSYCFCSFIYKAHSGSSKIIKAVKKFWSIKKKKKKLKKLKNNDMLLRNPHL